MQSLHTDQAEEDIETLLTAEETDDEDWLEVREHGKPLWKLFDGEATDEIIELRR